MVAGLAAGAITPAVAAVSYQRARELLIEAVIEEIAHHGDKAHERAVDIAQSVADRLLRPGAPGAIEEKDMRGNGLWLRQFDDLTPAEAAQSFSFVVIPGTRTGPVNRSARALAWMRSYRGFGGRIWIMDWLPTPAMGAEHLPELAEWAKSLGAEGIMADLEPDAGWRNALEAAEHYALGLRAAAGERGLATAYTDYGSGGNSDAVMRVLLSILDIGVPQSYDPNGAYAPGYHSANVAYWKARGARQVALGLGLWLRGERRHRTPEEFARHLEGADATGVKATITWYGGGEDNPARMDSSERALHAVLPIIAAYRPPGGKPALLDSLTPFAAALRDWLS